MGYVRQPRWDKCDSLRQVPVSAQEGDVVIGKEDALMVDLQRTGQKQMG